MNSNSSNHDIKYPRFINNAPCGLDLFEGKAQDKIANNISSGILDHPELKIIGIDGGWGAGKSNLVELVKKKLEEECHFFIYDAWGHQEDLQRRAFLEELTEYLTIEKFVSDEWKAKLKDLLAKKRETESKKVPKLSIGIIITGLLILLSPILKFVSDNVHSILWKTLILLTPFFIILILIAIFYRKEKSRTFLQRTKKAFSKLFLEYQNKIEEETKYETISEDEPSVRKFREWMSEISTDLKVKQKKLVVVFDNMDRLPQKKVQELWSSIHVFFAEHNYENIKVILPFDRSHIQNAFKTEDANNGQNFGDDFINKTFNVVYRVSPPILSDWKGYFKFQWKNAFGDNTVENENYNNVVQIFDLLSTAITPRKIIAFINEIVAIKQLAVETIPDKYISLFVFGKNIITKSPFDEIINPTYLKGLEFLYKSDEDLPKYIAALFYQVEPEHAIQIVFTNRLKEVLNNNQSEEVLKISEIPEFIDILENSIAEVTNFENAILAINKLPDEKLGNEFQKQMIWECLYKKVVPKNDSKLYDYQIALLANIKDKKSYLQTVLIGLTSGENFKALDYYRNIDELNGRFSKEFNVFEYLKSKETNVADFIDFVKNAREKYGNYKITCKEKELNDYLIAFDINKLSEIDFIPYLQNEYDFGEYKKKLEELISANAPNNNKLIISGLFDKYKEVSKDKPLKAKLEDPQIYTFWQASNPDEDFYYDLLSMRIAKLTNFNANYVTYFNDALQKTDSNIIKKVCERIEYYINYGDILLALKSFNQYPLFKAIANELTINSYGTSKAELVTILSSFDEICNKGDIDPITLIKKFGGASTEKITSQNISKTVSIFFVKNALETDCKLSKHCIDCLKEYLDSLDVNKWIEIFKDFNSYGFKVSQILPSYKFTQNAFDAIKDVLKQIAEKKIAIPDKTLWNDLIQKIEGQERNWQGTFNGIRDLFCREDNTNPELFKFFSDWLFKYSVLSENSSSLRTIFKSTVINDNECLQTIISNKQQMPAIINTANVGEAREFKDLIQERLKDNNTEEFIEFAKQIGIEKKEVNKDSVEEQSI
ncbi:MAG: hypothetical protein EPN39_04420 [Chitinophagaceae bacterium]|nr:MAG: hypothetical protein EPN39_04420 [Chitinophagaceae bacterium]